MSESSARSGSGRAMDMHAFRLKSADEQVDLMRAMTPDEADALVDWQAATPLRIVLEDPNVYMTDAGPVAECWTQRVASVLCLDIPSRCFVDEPAVQLTIRCRTCGVRAFTVCGHEIENVKAGVAHTALWCVYCTQAVAAHEVIEVLAP